MSKLYNKPKEQSRKQGATDPSLTLALAKKKKQVRRKKKRTGPKNRNQNAFVKSMAGPHPCIVHYASCIADPEFTPQGACIPYGFPVPTQRIKTFMRGTFALGTTGQGYIAAGLPIGNDSTIGAQTTTATSVGTANTALNSFTNQQQFGYTKLPYSKALLDSGAVSGRVVSSMIKCRYAGTEANRNGIVTSIENPVSTAATALGNLTMNTISQFTASVNERPSPTGEWHVVKYTGPTQQNMAQLQSSSAWEAYGLTMALVINGTASDKYEFECYSHYEFAGNSVPGTNMTHSDEGMFSKVVESFKSITTSSPLNNNNARSGFSNFLSEAGSSIWNYIKKEGMSMALSTVSNAFLPGSGSAVKLLTG